jgi:hypothetical protein
MVSLIRNHRNLLLTIDNCAILVFQPAMAAIALVISVGRLKYIDNQKLQNAEVDVMITIVLRLLPIFGEKLCISKMKDLASQK